jgi:hypothetical protein
MNGLDNMCGILIFFEQLIDFDVRYFKFPGEVHMKTLIKLTVSSLLFTILTPSQSNASKGLLDGASEVVEVRVPVRFQGGVLDDETDRMLDQAGEGRYVIDQVGLRAALNKAYSPKADEPSVTDLIHKFKIHGKTAQFWEGINELTNNGNPVAMCFKGYRLVTRNMAAKNGDYYEGLQLLELGAASGIAYANFLLAMWSEDDQKALAHFDKATDFPHSLVCYALRLKDVRNGYDSEILSLLARGADAGDAGAATALAEYYEEVGDFASAYRWYVSSYHGPTAMDWFLGLRKVIEFVQNKDKRIGPSEQLAAEREALNWLKLHPQAFMDGYDLDRDSATAIYQVPPKSGRLYNLESVQTLFWTTYALGDRKKFFEYLESFVGPNDANALFMKAYQLIGFGGTPQPLDLEKGGSELYKFLELAASKLHPLACMELALRLLTTSQGSTKLPETYKWLVAAHERWSGTEYKAAIADMTFILGYLTEQGYCTEADPVKGRQYMEEVRYSSAIAMGYLAPLIGDPVESYAHQLACGVNFTEGDWFNGIYPQWAAAKKLTKDQKVAANLRADQIIAEHPELRHTIYQKLGNGLDEAFAGK